MVINEQDSRTDWPGRRALSVCRMASVAEWFGSPTAPSVSDAEVRLVEGMVNVKRVSSSVDVTPSVPPCDLAISEAI